MHDTTHNISYSGPCNGKLTSHSCNYRIFASADKRTCLAMKPTMAPSLSPSSNPSEVPTSMPTGVCGRGKGLLEITVEGDEFVDEISWNVRDMFDNTILSHTGQGIYSIQKCIDLIPCYTFSIYDSVEDDLMGDGIRGVCSVKFDGEVIISGNNFRSDHTTMFGISCLQNGDTACTSPGAPTDMSMFRLELATDDGDGITWSLTNGSNEVVQSGGPFGDCNVNSLAMCLPREDCYEFTLIDSTGDDASYGKGLYTVMFSHTKDMVQNYTRQVGGTNKVFLGTCYDTKT